MSRGASHTRASSKNSHTTCSNTPVEQCESTVDNETLECVNVRSNEYNRTRHNAGDGDTKTLEPRTTQNPHLATRTY